MTRDDEHEERGILGRLRRRRSQAQATPASNLFTARAEPSTPVPPPVEPPPERLFDGVDRWDEPPSAPEDDAPLFSEAEGLDAPVTADSPVAPPPPAPTPPPAPRSVPSIGDPDASPIDAETALPPGPHDPPPPPSGPIEGPAVLDAPPSPAEPLFGPAAGAAPTDDFFASSPSAGAARADGPTGDVDPEAADLADLTDELHRYATEDAVEEPDSTGLWSHLAEPFELRDRDEDTPASEGARDELADNLFVSPPKPAPPAVHLTEKDLAEPEPPEDDAPVAGWLHETTAPRSTEADDEVAEPDEELDEPAAVAPVWREDETPGEPDLIAPPAASVFAPEDEASPLLDQIAREFGDPRAALHQMVEDDLEDLPPAAAAPPAPTLDEPDVPMTDAAVAPPPALEDEDADAFPPAAEESIAAAEDLLFAPAPEPEITEDVSEEPEPAEAQVASPEPSVAPLPSPPVEAREPAVEETPAAQPAAQAETEAADDEPTSAPGWAAGSQPIPLSTEPATHGPSTIRVHDERLENRPGPIKMSPSEAVILAQEGPKGLKKRRPKSS